MPANTSVPALLERPCPFITFYSFKGGVGRSMAVINVASIIASRGFRVLIIDMDLEAPGISYLANQASSDEVSAQPGFIDYLTDAVERGPESDLWSEPAATSVGRYCARYELPEDSLRDKAASLHIMPAGRLDRDYPSRLEKLNLRELYCAGEGLALITAFKQAIQESKLFDYVFIDSRTGFSDESGICTRDLADYLMIVSGLNKQNVGGTTQFLAALRKATGGDRQFKVILSPVPNGEDALVDQRERAAEVAFEAGWGAPVRLELRIPYHPQLALTEEPHIFRRRSGYLFDAYHRIERHLLRMIGDTSDRFLNAAMTTMKAGQWSLTMTLLKSAESLSDHPDWVTPFALALASLDPVPASPDSLPVYKFVSANANAQLKRHLADTFGKRAVDLARERKNLDAAETLFKGAIDADPFSSVHSGDYAFFLNKERGDVEAAEILYKRALDIEPTQVNNLNNYAYFLQYVRKDLDAAEALYKRATDAGPDHPGSLGNYAYFLRVVRGDMDAAEILYKRAIDANPFHSSNLGTYAGFLQMVRKDMDTAEVFYKRALDAAPNDAVHIANYARFLHSERSDMDGAETYYKRAIEAAPSHPGILGNYANFLHTVRKDMGAAESIYRRALEVDPANADNLGNYAHLCITSGRPLEGLILVDRALAASNSDTPQVVELECQMYLYCCGAPERGNIALSRLKHLITIEHLDTGEWDFSGVIMQAEKMGHPEARWLPALAEVLAKRATASSLDAWDAWRVAS